MYSKIKAVKSNKRSYVELLAVAVPLTAMCFPFVYRISSPNQYLVRTGLGIKDISIKKKAIVLPYVHTEQYINMNPQNYEFKLHAMSIEKIPFILPAFFTIGPKNDEESLIKYARSLSNTDFYKIISGLLEGETRTLASKMTMEEIFNDRQTFKDTIIKGVEEELDQFGLTVFSANIKELQDFEDSKYFFNMMQQKASLVENDAKIAVSEANKLGNIGEKERQAITRQQIALLEATTIKQENDCNKNIEISKAELSVITSEADQKIRIAAIESENNAAMKAYDMMSIVEQKRYEAELLKSKATILPNAVMEAEAVKINAEATFYAKLKESEGIKTVYMAQAEGMHELLNSFNGDKQALIQYLMLDNQLYEKLADSNARAVQGLKPNITMFSTGTPSQSENPVNDLIKMGMPIALSYLNNQVNIKKE